MNTLTIYNNVHDLCTLNHITVKKLEELIGAGSATIARWKTVKPNIETLMRVADYFSVSLDFLCGRDSTVQRTSTELIPNDLVININRLNDDGIKLLTAMAKSLSIQDEYRK